MRKRSPLQEVVQLVWCGSKRVLCGGSSTQVGRVSLRPGQRAQGPVEATEVVDVPKEEHSPLGLCLLEQFASGMSAAGKQVMLLF